MKISQKLDSSNGHYTVEQGNDAPYNGQQRVELIYWHVQSQSRWLHNQIIGIATER